MKHSSQPYYEEINLQQFLEVNYFFVFTSNIRKILQLDERFCTNIVGARHAAHSTSSGTSVKTKLHSICL